MMSHFSTNSVIEKSTLNSIIQFDNYDHLSRNILCYLNPSSIVDFALVCRRTMEIVSHHAPSAKKAIHIIRFKRLLVHENFKSILAKIENENNKTQKAKFTHVMLEFYKKKCALHQIPVKYNILEQNYLQLGRLSLS